MVSLNSAFLKLCHSKAQFLLIGPNISGVKTGKNDDISFKFIRTDFKTVATDIEYVTNEGALDAKCIEIDRDLNEQTLIFCKSPASATSLANKLVNAGIHFDSAKARELARWLRENYHPDWELAKFMHPTHQIAFCTKDALKCVKYIGVKEVGKNGKPKR